MCIRDSPITDTYRVENALNDFRARFSVEGEYSNYCGLYGYTLSLIHILFDNYLKPESIRMFESIGVMTKKELEARNEVKWEDVYKRQVRNISPSPNMPPRSLSVGHPKAPPSTPWLMSHSMSLASFTVQAFTFMPRSWHSFIHSGCFWTVSYTHLLLQIGLCRGSSRNEQQGKQ